ncbi:MAG: exodeoxyribonuclease VII large subunit, partial [Deltaproteobacteria bacterium]|nr:exodeoxyribonuclease VII large subunit [Deltaproteobacteria bacterium]
FDVKIKKPLPFLPRRVAVITSPTGAAVRDFLKVIRRRFANIEIIVVPVKVQGEEATAEIVEALELVNRELDVDVIVLTRGGGSLEDLWAFNREELALAIRASRVPVVSAVGHEIDVTISDLAADFRAPTPSAAAELLVVEKEALEERLATLRDRVQLAMRSSLAKINQRLEFLAKGLRDPRKRLADLWMRLDEVSGRILRRMELILKEDRKRLQAEERTLILHSPAQIISAQGERLEFCRKSLVMVALKKFQDYRIAIERLEGKLGDLSPLNVLKRGYSITRKLPEMIILRDVSGVCEGDRVNVRLSEGGLDCVVTKVTE